VGAPHRAVWILPTTILVALILLVPTGGRMPSAWESGAVHSLSGTVGQTLAPGATVSADQKRLLGPSVSSQDPYVLAAISPCSGATTIGGPEQFCGPSGPLAVAYDSVDHLLFLSNDANCYGCTDYVLAYNDSTNNITWSFVTGSGLAGQDPVAMTFVPSNDSLYVSDEESNIISVLNASTGSEVATISIGSPGGQAFNPSTGYLYIADTANNSLGVVQTTTNSLIGYWPIPHGAAGIAYDRGANLLFASTSQWNCVYALNAANGSLVATIPVLSWPEGLYYYAPQGKVFVADASANNVSVINDTQLSVVTNISKVNAPSDFALDLSNGSLYVSNSGGAQFFQIDPATDSLSRTIHLSFVTSTEPQPMVFDTDTGSMYIVPESSNLEVVRPGANYSTTTLVGDDPVAAYFDAASDQAYVADSSHCDLIPINTSTLAVGASFYAGCDPMGVAYDPNNGNLYVSYFGTYDTYGGLTAVNLATHAVVGTWLVGYDATGVAYDPTDQDVFVGSYYNISVYHPASNTWSWSVYSYPGGLNPNNPAVYFTWDAATDVVYVTLNSIVLELDAKLYTVLQSYSMRGLLYGSTLDPAVNRLYVSQGSDQNGETNNVTVLNATTLELNTTVSTCGEPEGVVYDPTVARVYAACTADQDVGIIDPSTNTDTGTIGLGDPGSLALPVLLQGGLLGETGSNGEFAIVSPGIGWFGLQFQETGLPAWTSWTVSWNGSSASTHRANLIFLTQNASAGFAVPSPYGFVPIPSSGTGTVNGTNVTVPISFHPAQRFRVEFQEYGLPVGTPWSITLNGFGQRVTTSYILFSEPNGTYPYAIGDVSGWHQQNLTYSGNVTVAGTDVYEPDLNFTRVRYNVSFGESGLPTGISWSVTFNGSKLDLTTNGGTDNLSFPVEPNGSYQYVVGAVAGWCQSTIPYFGNEAVDNGTLQLLLTYSQTVYPVSFHESGLPANLAWNVTFDGVAQQLTTTGNSASLSFAPEPNGTFPYSIASVPGWFQDSVPRAGNLTVHGQTLSVSLVYRPVVYPVIFTESGLSIGAEWFVNVSGWPSLSNVTSSTGGSTVTAELPNGTYNFSAASADKRWTPSYSPEFTVAASGQRIGVSFSLLTYPVNFSEGGLPAGVDWSVQFNGTVHSLVSDGGTDRLSFAAVTNGTYAYSIEGVAGWHQSTVASTGTTLVDGAPLVVNLTYAQTTYTVTFAESGLPAGLTWAVTVNGTTRSLTTNGQTDHVVFIEANGSYPFSIGGIPGWSQSGLPYTGVFDVMGENVSESVASYSQVRYTVEFVAAGLPPGSGWSLTVSGGYVQTSRSTAIELSLPNGTYTYTPAANDTAYQSAAGHLTVNGSAVVITVGFHPTAWLVRFIETGLPPGTTWSVVLNAVSGANQSGSISFLEPNGTYSFTIGSVPGYQPSPTSGNLTVHGSEVSVQVSFVHQTSFFGGLTFVGLAVIVASAVAAAGAVLGYLWYRRRPR